MLRQKESELKENDLYWRKRMQELENSLEKTNSILETEYNQTVRLSLNITGNIIDFFFFLRLKMLRNNLQMHRHLINYQFVVMLKLI